MSGDEDDDDYNTDSTKVYYKLNLTAGQAVYFSQPYTERNVIEEIFKTKRGAD